VRKIACGLAGIGVGLVVLVAGAAPAAAKDVARVPVCDLDGHCDRHCIVSTDAPFVRCGYGP
jgi:hypothetical protein